MMKHITPELIQSLTPMFIALVGGIIGVTVLVTDTNDPNSAKWSSGMGLAGTALAGAAGLAQSSKSGATISDQDSKPNPNKEIERTTL